MPAQGKPACTGSTLTATSPTALNLFNQYITLLASSLKVIVRPANINVHFFSRQHRYFSLAATKACLSAESISLESGRM